MSRQQRAAEAHELRATGLNGIQIAEQMGISRTYAYELLNDPDGAKDRARKDSYRGTCLDCGGPTCGNDGPSKAAARCKDCDQVIAGDRSRAYMDAQFRDQRERFAAMYRNGLSLREMADALDMSIGSVRSKLHGLRHEHGYDLPYRYTMRDGKRVAA